MRRLLLLVLFVAGAAAPAAAQRGSVSAPDSALLHALQYRHIGPFRGGRSAAVAGVPGAPRTYYFGAAGGGVWKSTDGGGSWDNLSDGYFGGSIGAVAVSDWDPNVIYVGGGEKTVRGNVSHGYGMWKSEDAGTTWRAIGLQDTRHITRIRIHPKNPDLVYASVLGHLFGPSDERGVYRSEDGGETWERILFANADAGAVDLVMDAANPRVLYASTWRVRRTPYALESGGEGSQLWKSTDGGDTWTELTGRDNGLPAGTLGIIGVAPSPADPDRVWAIVEAEEGGVFRSDDAGATWRRINDDRNLRQRAWYYTRLYADPQDRDVVYVLNVAFWKSKDGGRTYESIDTPHSDHHDLWIAPEDPSRMVVGDDGGAQVTYDGGASWSTYHNQPTAQFYRVATDDHVPYRILGAQQDNSTVRILHRASGGAITEDDWEPTAGGESGWLAPHPDDPEIVYGGSYGGYLTRVDHRTDAVRVVNVWPDNPMGQAAKDLRYRFQWNFPIVFSRYRDEATGEFPLYAAAQHLFRTLDGGERWERISPDLTRNDTTKMGSSGGPITKDNTSVEYYGTIFTLAESVHEPGVIWTGSDDGLVHLTRDGGATWTDVTPPRLPEFAQINDMVAHPFEPGGLYVAATRYKWDDFTPYLYRTTDWGRTWTRIDEGIDRLHFTRAIEADPVRRGLLFAGTESGLYASFDDGASWRPFQQNLPIVPVTDLTIKDHDLVVATQGRSFWVMDDLTPLHALASAAERPVHLFAPRPTYRMPGYQGRARYAGTNAPGGAVLTYALGEAADSSTVRLHVLEADGDTIRTFTPEDDGLAVTPGTHRFVWNLAYEGAETFPGLVLWGGGTGGPDAAPGTYRARLEAAGETVEVPFEVRIDPRSTATAADLQAQFDFLIAVRDKLTETHEAILRIRDVRDQVDGVVERAGEDEGAEAIRTAGETLVDRITEVEEALYQTKNRSSQDPLNYPIRLNNRLSALVGVVSTGDYRPTEQAYAVRDEITALIDAQLARLDRILSEELPAFNALVRDASVPAVVVAAD